jgi:chemotaxis protein methyltransferase CheR
MVAARLWKQTRLHGFPSIEAYLQAVESDVGQRASGEMLSSLIDALTTNYTSFFREPAHFDFLRERILPGLRQRARIPIWSAACSSGEEAYSIAITLAEALGAEAPLRAGVLATDISTRVLRIAREAVYPADRFRGFPEDWKRRYLLRGTGQQEGNYRIRPQLRQLVEFRHLNLMEALPPAGPFPLIFLRNIMIYFDRPTQEKVVRTLHAKLEPGGFLFIGHSESLNGLDHGLEHVQVAIYRKPLAEVRT